MSLLKKPLITEKASALNERSVYGFIVDNNANKIEIKKEVERIYGVAVQSINTMRYAGKPKTKHTKRYAMRGKSASYKKALVTLGEGEVIDFYSSSN